MRYQPVPEFAKKLVALDTAGIADVGDIVRWISASDSARIRSGAQSLDQSNETELLMVSRGTAMVFFTFAKDEQGDFILLVDLIGTPRPLAVGSNPGIRDPRLNNRYNPNHNHRLNPTWNKNLNPIWNRALNPIWNKNLSPIWNKAINPIWNKNLDPIWNKALSPIWNKNINPVWNRTIDPRLLRPYPGKVYYDRELQPQKYLAKATDSAYALLNGEGSLVGYLFKGPEDTWIEFDANLNHVGHLVEAEEDVWIAFKDLSWDGLVV